MMDIMNVVYVPGTDMILTIGPHKVTYVTGTDLIWRIGECKVDYVPGTNRISSIVGDF